MTSMDKKINLQTNVYEAFEKKNWPQNKSN